MHSMFGTVVFENGRYAAAGGSPGWRVEPVGGIPLGQVRIAFETSRARPYAVQVSAMHGANTPLLSANYGEADDTGFVVHLWESVADRTVANGGFSFFVAEAET